MKKYILIILTAVLILRTNVSFGSDSSSITKEECYKYKFDFKKITEVYFPDPYYDEIINERGTVILKSRGYFIYDGKRLEPFSVSPHCKNVILKGDEMKNFPDNCFIVITAYTYWNEKKECLDLKGVEDFRSECSFICSNKRCLTISSYYAYPEFDIETGVPVGFYEDNDVCGYKNILNPQNNK